MTGGKRVGFMEKEAFQVDLESWDKDLKGIFEIQGYLGKVLLQELLDELLSRLTGFLFGF